MNVLQNALMNGLLTEVLDQLVPELPLIGGDVISLSSYGKSMYDGQISWTNYAMTANFIRTQDAPYNVTEYGTVQIIEEPRLVIQLIHTEASKVSFNSIAFKKMEKQKTLIDWYTSQITAKVTAWDERINNIILFGIPTANVPGLLQGSGIPLVTSLVNMSSASVDAIINEFVRLCLIPSVSSQRLFKPSLIGIPSDLYNILNTRNFSSTGAVIESVLDVILKRLQTSDGYNKPGQPQWKITSVPQFNTNKIMTILPEDANQIGAGIWDLESFYSTDNSESHNETQEGCASSHCGGYLGVVAKRPSSGCVVTVTY
jgi:hypothetical protein